jgi:predicted DNA-binding transcriptional regulator AlpA
MIVSPFRKSFITATEVADFLELPYAAFLSKREELIAEHGFPEPMPFSKRPMRWRSDRVAAWVEEQGLPRAETAALPPRPTGPNIILLNEARTP